MAARTVACCGTTLRVAGVGIRRAFWRALAIGLSIAAGTAVVALVSGSFDELDAQVIGISLGFSIFSATAAAGAALVRHGGGATRRAVGSATMALSAAAFLALSLAIWAVDAEALWQTWGTLSIATLVGSHASLVLR